MRCEVVAVGTELLLGQIVDTNSSWIGEQLALAGIDSLPPDQGRRQRGPHRGGVCAWRSSAADAVIVCGGLGPTQDDITRDVIAHVMGVELELDDEVADRIGAMFGGRGRRMPMNNLRQAEVPEGATRHRRPAGHRAGPGLPGRRPRTEGHLRRARRALRDEGDDAGRHPARPAAPGRGEPAVIRSRTLRTWGESESGLAERLAGRIDALDRPRATPRIAFLASGIEGLKVRITAKAADRRRAEALAGRRGGRGAGDPRADLVFGSTTRPWRASVLDLLGGPGPHARPGRVAHRGAGRVADHRRPGRQRVFRGVVVSYATEVKLDLLDVPEGPVVSEAAAVAMAAGARRVLGADVGAGLTGVAGPITRTVSRPAPSSSASTSRARCPRSRLQLPGDRLRVRQFSVISALGLLRTRLAARLDGDLRRPTGAHARLGRGPVGLAALRHAGGPRRPTPGAPVRHRVDVRARVAPMAYLLTMPVRTEGSPVGVAVHRVPVAAGVVDAFGDRAGDQPGARRPARPRGRGGGPPGPGRRGVAPLEVRALLASPAGAPPALVRFLAGAAPSPLVEPPPRPRTGGRSTVLSPRAEPSPASTNPAIGPHVGQGVVIGDGATRARIRTPPPTSSADRWRSCWSRGPCSASSRPPSRSGSAR